MKVRTTVNTRRKNGAITQIERSMEWFILCERATFEVYAFTFLMVVQMVLVVFPEKQLGSCENPPIVNFRPIEVELPFVDFVDTDLLSSDQKYPHGMCLAISSGNVTNDLSYKHSGLWDSQNPF